MSNAKFSRLLMYIKKIKSGYFRPVRIIKFLFRVAKAPKNYYSPLTLKYYVFIISYLRCYLQGGFSTDEVFHLGLGSSFPTRENINKFVSYSNITKIDRVVNPRSWAPIKHNKGIFHMICKNLNLPVPKLYAIIFKNNLSISYLNSLLIKKNDLIKFIREELPDEFVIKPETGSMGWFVNIYTKTNLGIIDGFGNLKTEQEIIESMMNNKQYNSFVVQEKLRNHPYLADLFPSESLHNIRIMTLIDSSGHCKILHAHLQIATGQNIASQQGDLRIQISLDDGTLDYGMLYDKKNGGFNKVTEHSGTDRNLREYKLPLWEDLLLLAEEAAFKFLPLRTLGWDITITEKGLKILEANSPYTPPNLFEAMDEFTKILLNS